MEKVKLEIEVPKEIHEVGVALGEILNATAKALADGFQITDVPNIISESIANLIPAIKGVQEIGEEFKAMPVATVMGALIPVAEGVQALIDMKKE